MTGRSTIDPAAPGREDRHPAAWRRAHVPWLAALTAAVVVLVIALTMTIRDAASPRVPNLAALTRSPQVKGPDEESSAALLAQFAGIGRRAPWLAGVARGVSDSCQLGSQESQIVLGQATWSAQCERAETFFYGFGGDLGRRLSALRHALTGQGWAAQSPAVTPSRSAAGLLMAASTSPAVFGPGMANGLPALPGKVVMEVAWAGRGNSLNAVRALTVSGSRPDAENRFDRAIELQPVSLGSVTRKGFLAHAYLLVIRITTQYYQNPDVQP